MKLSTHNHLSILNLQYLLQVGVNNQIHKKKYSRLSNRTNLFCYASKKIININKEIYNIRKYLNLITSIISKGGSILVNIEKNVYLYKTFRQYKTNVIHNICLLNSLWVNGLLTNHKVYMKIQALIHKKYFLLENELVFRS
jgi:ribosomal protein S2